MGLEQICVSCGILEGCPTDICKSNLSKLLKQVGFKILKDENGSTSVTKMAVLR